jgi:tRNA pseudouridine(55) synthase
VHGWLVIDKPVGPGSTQVVAAVKRALREGGYPKAKVGHGGTLDPLASGVLPVALGEATKLCGRMLNADKTYHFTIRFGRETDTLDAEGEVIATSERRPTRAEVEAVLPGFTGQIAQVPPVFSALKVGGRRAYDLATGAGKSARHGSQPAACRRRPRSRTGPRPSPRGAGPDYARRPRLQRHLHTLARPRHRPSLGFGRPCHHVEEDRGGSLRPRNGDFAGQIGASR